MLIPIHFSSKEDINDSICYIIGGNGTFLKKSTLMIDSITRVEKIPDLPDVRSWAKLKTTKIPSKIFGQVVSFLRKVYDDRGTEAVVYPYYHKDSKEWEMYVPKEIVSQGSTKADRKPGVGNMYLAGSIHSHCSFGSSHSNVDISGEKNIDGLHIVCGIGGSSWNSRTFHQYQLCKLAPQYHRFANNQWLQDSRGFWTVPKKSPSPPEIPVVHEKDKDDDTVTITASLVVNGNRFELNPSDYICGLHQHQAKEEDEHTHIGYKWHSNEKKYIIPTVKFPDEWLDQVSEAPRVGTKFNKDKQKCDDISHEEILEEFKMCYGIYSGGWY